MKGLKGSKGLYISIGMLCVAIAGSGLFYKKEADKAKRTEADVTKWRESLDALQDGVPTEEHREFMEKQKEEVEKEYQAIVREILRWNDVPQKMSGLDFQGNMLTTVRMIRTDAERHQIMIDPRAMYLGFDEYAVSPPGLDDDVLQLQREFSAAVDIARLLIASDVYSIDRMSRRQEALMEEGASTARLRLGGELSTTVRQKKPKYDFYDTVPFQVRFSCTYASLAFFQKSLITPRKIRIGNEEYPRNFLVVNDLWFKVKEVEGGAAEALGSAIDRARTATWALAEKRGPLPVEVPDDLPGAVGMLERDREWALRFFNQWRTLTSEQKEIYRLNQTLLHKEASNAERARARSKLARMQRELQYRKLPGRPPEYNIIEVTMLIDFVEFNDKLTAELKPEASGPKPLASPLSTAKR